MNANMREVCQAIVDEWKTRYSQTGESDGEFESELMKMVEETEENSKQPFLRVVSVS